jgi:hypothetical protein
MLVVRLVRDLLTHEPSGTMILVDRDGRVRTEPLHAQRAVPWPRERPIATFVTTASPPSETEIRARLELGLRKLALAG